MPRWSSVDDTSMSSFEGLVVVGMVQQQQWIVVPNRERKSRREGYVLWGIASEVIRL